VIEYLQPIDVEALPEAERTAKGVADYARSCIKNRLSELDAEDR